MVILMRYACKACLGFVGVYARHRRDPLQRDFEVEVELAFLPGLELNWNGLLVPCMEEYHHWRMGLM